MGVDLSDVCRYRRETQRQRKAGVLDGCSERGRTIEVSVRDLLDLAQLAELVCKERKPESTLVFETLQKKRKTERTEELVHLKLALEELESAIGETLGRSVGAHTQDCVGAEAQERPISTEIRVTKRERRTHCSRGP